MSSQAFSQLAMAAFLHEQNAQLEIFHLWNGRWTVSETALHSHLIDNWVGFYFDWKVNLTFVSFHLRTRLQRTEIFRRESKRVVSSWLMWIRVNRLHAFIYRTREKCIYLIVNRIHTWQVFQIQITYFVCFFLYDESWNGRCLSFLLSNQSPFQLNKVTTYLIEK